MICIIAKVTKVAIITQTLLDRILKRSVMWSHQGLNLGPPDYESGATNQLSYRTKNLQWFGVVTEPHCKYNTFFCKIRLVELDFNLNT